MRLGGSITYQNVERFGFLDIGKNNQQLKYLIYDKYKGEDEAIVSYGGVPEYKVLTLKDAIIGDCRDYIHSYIYKGAGVFKLPETDGKLITEFIELQNMILTYVPDDTEIITYEESTTNAINETKIAEIKTDTMYIKYKLINHVLQYLVYKDDKWDIKLYETPDKKVKLFNKEDLLDITNIINNKFYKVAVSELKFSKVIESEFDNSWYKDKDYKMPTSMLELRLGLGDTIGRMLKNPHPLKDKDGNDNGKPLTVISRMLQPIEDLKQKKSGKYYSIRNRLMRAKVFVSLDFETEGFEVYRLEEGHPILKLPTSMQISISDDESYIVPLRMSHFNNINPHDVSEFLRPFFEEVLPKERNKVKTYTMTDGTEVEFCRNDICLIGNNAIFDSMVSCFDGKQFFFDEDIIQILFDLDSFGTQGKKSLKYMTNHIHGIKQWSLTELVGKGCEGMFGELSDIDLVKFYGGADSDFTRLNWFAIMPLMDDLMYKSYKNYQVYLFYIFALKAFNGMRVNYGKLKELGIVLTKDIELIEDFMYRHVGLVVKQDQIKRELSLKYPNLSYKESKTIIAKGIEMILNSDPDSLRYEFKPSGNKLTDILYGVLGYKVEERTESGELPNNKSVRKKWQRYKVKRPNNYLKTHIYSSGFNKDDKNCYDKDGNILKDYILIDKDDFNSDRYPLARVLDRLNKLRKTKSTYVDPRLNSYELDLVFTVPSPTKQKTFRISDPLTTVEAPQKFMYTSYSPDYYYVNYDMNQIEGRECARVAGDYDMVALLNGLEADFHTENGARVFNVPPHLLPSELRKKSKTVNFGVMFGQTKAGIVSKMFTIDSIENRMEANRIYNTYLEKNHVICNYMDHKRKESTTEWEPGEEFRKFFGYEGRKLARVTNPNGFYRMWDITDMTSQKQLASVERAGGNFPIQSSAKDGFFLTVIRLFIKIKEMGWRDWEDKDYREPDKWLFHVFVHDEANMSVHRSIDPRLMVRVIREACILGLPTQKPLTPYINPETNNIPPEDSKEMRFYIGLAVSEDDSWGGCKKGDYELCEGALEEIAYNDHIGKYEHMDWCDNAAKVLGPLQDAHILRRINETIVSKQEGIDNAPIYPELIQSKFTEYTVRGNLYKYYKGKSMLPKLPEEGDTLIFYANLANWTERYYGSDKKVYYKDKVMTLEEFKVIILDEANTMADDISEKEDKKVEVVDVDSKEKELMTLMDDIDDEVDDQDYLFSIADSVIVLDYDDDGSEIVESRNGETVNDVRDSATKVSKVGKMINVSTTLKGLINICSHEDIIDNTKNGVKLNIFALNGTNRMLSIKSDITSEDLITLSGV